MKRSFAVSSIAHIVFLALVIGPGYQKSYYPGSEVISVRLVGKDKPAEKQKPTTPQPKEQKPVEKKQPSKPKMAYKSSKKTREAKPKKKSSGSKTAPARTAPKGGAKSNITVDDKDFRFAYYLEIIKDRVSNNWSPPPVAGSPDGVVSTVYFRISREGRISDIKIEKSSESDLFDRSALRAVNLASPLPPLPAGFRGGWLGVHFEFQQESG